jgi:hypothetical protein
MTVSFGAEDGLVYIQVGPDRLIHSPSGRFIHPSNQNTIQKRERTQTVVKKRDYIVEVVEEEWSSNNRGGDWSQEGQ